MEHVKEVFNALFSHGSSINTTLAFSLTIVLMLIYYGYLFIKKRKENVNSKSKSSLKASDTTNYTSNNTNNVSNRSNGNSDGNARGGRTRSNYNPKTTYYHDDNMANEMTNEDIDKAIMESVYRGKRMLDPAIARKETSTGYSASIMFDSIINILKEAPSMANVLEETGDEYDNGNVRAKLDNGRVSINSGLIQLSVSKSELSNLSIYDIQYLVCNGMYLSKNARV